MPGIKKDVLEFCSGKTDAISQYEMRSNDGTAFRFQLVIKKCLEETKDKRRWECLIYATNLERRRIKRTMKRSRGIQSAGAYSRWNCTQNLTDCISKLGKLGSTSNYYTHTYDVANACFQSWRYKHVDNHGKDMRALEHDHSISNRFSEWRRQLVQTCGMPFTSDAYRCDL